VGGGGTRTGQTGRSVRGAIWSRGDRPGVNGSRKSRCRRSPPSGRHGSDRARDARRRCARRKCPRAVMDGSRGAAYDRRLSEVERDPALTALPGPRERSRGLSTGGRRTFCLRQRLRWKIRVGGATPAASDAPAIEAQELAPIPNAQSGADVRGEGAYQAFG
jgi:hypothetical protein